MLNLLDKKMWVYIITDIGMKMEYLPYGILFGLLAYIAVRLIVHRDKKSKYSFIKAMLLIYFFALIHITLFEREPGSRTAVSLTLFETFGDSRANAYVIENVILFIPFGLLFAFFMPPMRKLLISIAAGIFCSLIIETTQCITQRGFFQVDDILMNSIGSMIGCICFRLIKFICCVYKRIITKRSDSVKR